MYSKLGQHIALELPGDPKESSEGLWDPRQSQAIVCLNIRSFTFLVSSLVAVVFDQFSDNICSHFASLLESCPEDRTWLHPKGVRHVRPLCLAEIHGPGQVMMCLLTCTGSTQRPNIQAPRCYQT